MAGYDVFEQPIEAKRRTGYLPETPPLYPDMTVREYLTFAAKIKMRTKASAAERKARVDEVMKKTFVADMANRHCGKLSKGYRQRVGLAQAIIHNPDVLILDEPTQYLDVTSQQEFYKLLKQIKETTGLTVFLISHDLFTVMKNSDQVICINGHVCCIGKPNDAGQNLDFKNALSEIGFYVHSHDHRHNH